MSLKQFFCQHEYELLDTHATMVVACRKCGKILSVTQSVKWMRERAAIKLKERRRIDAKDA